MTLLWTLYWPVLAAALAIGLAGGWRAFRPSAAGNRRTKMLAGAAALTIAAVALWHGPGGAADRFAAIVEQASRAELDRLELPAVRAALARGPLERTLVLAGPADDFQRSELPNYMIAMPGVAEVRWAGARGGYGIPLLAEAAAAALIALGLGILLAYLVELRRRANADRRW